jgi:hypothetical protein
MSGTAGAGGTSGAGGAGAAGGGTGADAQMAGSRMGQQQTVTIPASHGLPEARLQLAQEGAGQWKIDLPDNVDAQQLTQQLQQHLSKAAQQKDQWPADANEAARQISHHVFLAFSQQGPSQHGQGQHGQDQGQGAGAGGATGARSGGGAGGAGGATGGAGSTGNSTGAGQGQSQPGQQSR